MVNKYEKEEKPSSEKKKTTPKERAEKWGKILSVVFITALAIISGGKISGNQG